MLWQKVIGANAAFASGIEFISSSINTVAASSSITVTAPASIQDGDLLVAYCIINRTGRSLTLPAGFTQRLRIARATNDQQTLVIATKVASSESGNYTFTWNNTSAKTSVILVYRNAVDTSRLIGSQGEDDVATAVAPSISPTEEGALLAFFAAENTATVTTPPSGMVQRAFTSSRPPLAVYDITPNGTGATGDKTLVWSSAQDTSSILMQIHKG